MKWLIIVLGVFSNAAASILMKQAGNKLVLDDLIKTPWKLLDNFLLLSGVFLYFVAFLLYIVALKLFPLNVAHPILTSGAIAIVTLFAFFVFKEPMSLLKITGIIFILIGVIFITRG